MNEMNFDSLKKLKAPKEWLDKAAAIPETCGKKRFAFPVRRIAAAASIVLVSAVGLMTFMLFKDGSTGAPVAVRRGDMSATESSTAEAVVNGKPAAPEETTAVYSTDAQGNTVIGYRGKTTATESGVQPTEKRRSHVAPTAPNASAAHASEEATEKASPTARPTERIPNPTKPPVPANPPEEATEKALPTTRAAEHAPKPTETPVPTSAPATEPSAAVGPPVPVNPPEAQIPTEGISSVEGYLCFFATFDASLLNEGEAVYCIYSPADYAVGSTASAEKQQADYYITKNGTVCATCEVMINEPQPAEEITYQYYFVNERGHRLASGTQTV